MSNSRWWVSGLTLGLLLALSPSCGILFTMPGGTTKADGGGGGTGGSTATGGGAGSGGSTGTGGSVGTGGWAGTGGGAGTGGATGTGGWTNTGGGTGTGGSTACEGCRAPNGACVNAPFNSDSASCGVGGVACVNCALSGLTCNFTYTCSGTGTGGGTGSATLGQPCTTTGQCASLGSGALCKTTTSAGPAYGQGFCTLPCSAGSCPQGGVCTGMPGSLPALFGETQNFCVPGCSSTAGTACPNTPFVCYDNIVDVTLQMPQQGCWVDLNDPALPPYTAGGTPMRLGQGCTTDSECTPPDKSVAFCYLGPAPDGGATGFVGGYCMADCNLDNTGNGCGPNGFCMNIFGTAAQPNSACVARCNTPGSGRLSTGSANRLSEYVCRTVKYADGGVAGGRQWPACTAPGWSCGNASYPYCNTSTGYCCTAAGSSSCLN